MNSTSLKTENGHILYVKSMGKLHKVTHLAFNEVGHSHLFYTKALICVAELPNCKSVQVMAEMYGGDRNMHIECKSSVNAPYSSFYMKTYDNKYFQIAAVFTDVKEANAFMLERKDVALLDSTNIEDLDVQYHFIASMEESKTSKKAA